MTTMTKKWARLLALRSAANLIRAHLEVGGMLPQCDHPQLEWGSREYKLVETELRAIADSLGRRGAEVRTMVDYV